MKLVADTIVRHAWTHDILEAIVVALDFERSSDHGFNSIIVTHHLHLVDYSVLARTWALGSALRENLVVVSRDQEMGDSITSTDLDFTVMTS